MTTFDEESRDLDREEIRKEMRCKKYWSCPDRMCGATDCPSCRPENFRGGVLIDEMQDELMLESRCAIRFGDPRAPKLQVCRCCGIPDSACIIEPAGPICADCSPAMLSSNTGYEPRDCGEKLKP